MDRFDCIIVGGGLTGPALALALAGAGMRVAIIDARPASLRGEAGFDGRAYSLALASTRALSAIGVWPALTDDAQPILRIEAGEPAKGGAASLLSFDAADLEDGPMGHMVEDRHLYRAFLAAMDASPGVTHLPGRQVTAQTVRPGRVAVTLSDGQTLDARLLVGCDGRTSGTASRAGIRRTGWDYGQTALVTALRHETHHDGVARQVFLRGGPLAMLPLKGGHLSSIVWSEDRARAEAIHALPDDAYLAAQPPVLSDHLGKFRLAGARFSYPLSLSLAEHFVADRLALVGDAAHGVHPVAGQGLNLGLRDMAALAEVLVDAARRGEDIGAPDVLMRYQRWRRSDATLLALGMDAVNRLFSNANPLLRAARGLGVAAVQQAPSLRRAFQREAAGVAGDLPRLLAGRSL
jgi:2-octaprenyl-6-methoxyphenol hydroxylase